MKTSLSSAVPASLRQSSPNGRMSDLGNAADVPPVRPVAGFVALMLLFVFLLMPVAAQAVPITGSNGTTVDFAGVKEAKPEGLVVKILADSTDATVPWDKFDLTRLQADQPDIFAAYEKAKAGETTGLYLGVSAADKPKEMVEERKIPISQEHFVQTVVSGTPGSGVKSMTVAMRRPSSNAQAIFVGAFGEGRGGDELFSSIYLARGERSSWDEFLAQNKLVPLGFSVQPSDPDPRKEPFFLADKGTGEMLLKAIAALAKEAGRPDLADAPLVIYGREIMGSSFAYNFSQWKPERVACALAMKGGALFNVEPTEESVKVPFLILKGEYDDSHREWELEPTLDEQGRRIDAPHEAVNKYIATLPMKPNWTLMIEARGTSSFDPMTEMLGKEFVTAVVKQRFVGGEFQEMNPDIAQMGNLEEKSYKNMPDDQGELGPQETWLPDPAFAGAWKKFLLGELVPPPPAPPE